MKVKIYKSSPRGEVKIPPSKSVSHRMLICAALAKGESALYNLLDCDDVKRTRDMLSRLGAGFKEDGKSLLVTGIKREARDEVTELYASESGSTLRFIIPILLSLGGKYKIHAAKRLIERPLTVYEQLFPNAIKKKDGYIEVSGTLTSGVYRLRGDVSSQFISGLLFALPTLQGDSRIIIEGAFESRSYIDLTLDALKEFGVNIEAVKENEFFVPGGQSYKSKAETVEGDFSAAAFIEALGLLHGKVTALGLNEESLQGDRVYREIFLKLKNGDGEKIDLSDCPDNAPVLIMLAAALGGAHFTGTKRLKLKESDRAEAIREELLKLGASITVLENEVIVNKAKLFSPVEPILSHNDHRIVMAMAVLLTVYGGEILGAEAINKSYPDFFLHLAELGVKLEFTE